jgi:hypothetical protein
MTTQSSLPSGDLASSAVATTVAGHISRRLLGRLRDLEVIVSDQGLIIKGQSRTYHAKQLAQHVAAEVSPVPVLANEIEVA